MAPEQLVLTPSWVPETDTAGAYNGSKEPLGAREGGIVRGASGGTRYCHNQSDTYCGHVETRQVIPARLATPGSPARRHYGGRASPSCGSMSAWPEALPEDDGSGSLTEMDSPCSSNSSGGSSTPTAAAATAAGPSAWPYSPRGWGTPTRSNGGATVEHHHSSLHPSLLALSPPRRSSSGGCAADAQPDAQQQQQHQTCSGAAGAAAGFPPRATSAARHGSGCPPAASASYCSIWSTALASSSSCGMSMSLASGASSISVASSRSILSAAASYSLTGAASSCSTSGAWSSGACPVTASEDLWADDPADDPVGAGGACAGTSNSGCAWILSRFGGREVLADYEFGLTLGRGTFGVTRLVTERVSARPFACKTVCKERISSRQYIEDMRSEVLILQHLVGVPGVVQLRGAYEDCRAVNLVLELCAGGDLLDHILRHGRLSEDAAAAAARAILLALQRCHARGVIHRDVKPENFLLAEDGSAASCRASDFGVSAFFSPGQKFSEVVGTPYYMAPEVLLRCYDQSADIWSAGVVLYLMLSGELPFMGPTDRSVCAAVLRGKVSTDGAAWESVSDGAKAVVRRMLCRDPRMRATPEELLAHPWLARDAVAVAVAASQATALPPVAPPAAAACKGAAALGTAAAAPTVVKITAVAASLTLTSSPVSNPQQSDQQQQGEETRGTYAATAAA